MNEPREMREETAPELQSREEQLRSLLQAAYPAAEPDEALERSVAELVARHSVVAVRPSRWRLMPFARQPLASAAAALALLVAAGLLLIRGDHHGL
jgi:hypothetical protein